MKVIYLHQFFATMDMSIGTRAYEFTRRLARAGHEVHVIASRREAAGDMGWIQTDEDGVTVHWLPIPYSNNLSYPARIKAFFRFALAAGLRASRLGGDVVFATSTPLTIAIPAIFASRIRRIPMVFEVRDLWPELPIAIGAIRHPILKALAHWLEWLAYHSANHIIALSPGMAAGVQKQGIPASKITIIPNSTDTDLLDVPASEGLAFRETLGLTPDQPLIVYAGSLGLMNGVGYLVEIACEIQPIRPEVRFLIVGDGKDAEIIKARARELGLYDRVLWVRPGMPKREMPRVLSAATVATSLFIDLPQMWHNSANKFFDALAACRPVAINYQGWQSDILKESGAGLVLPAADARRAAIMLADFLSDPEQLGKASQAARQLAYDEFNRDTLYEKFEQILLNVTYSQTRV